MEQDVNRQSLVENKNEVHSDFIFNSNYLVTQRISSQNFIIFEKKQ